MNDLKKENMCGDCYYLRCDIVEYWSSL